MKLSKAELREEVRVHARENYEDGCWSYVEECLEDDDIDEIIFGARSAKGAIKKMYNDYVRHVENEKDNCAW